MIKTHLKEYRDHDIEVDENGKFYSTIGGRDVKRSSLKALQKLIDKQFSGVKALLVERYRINKPLQTEIVSLEGERYRTKSGELLSSYTPVYIFDDSALKELNKIYQEKLELDRKWRNATKKLKEMEAEQFFEFSDKVN